MRSTSGTPANAVMPVWVFNVWVFNIMLTAWTVAAAGRADRDCRRVHVQGSCR